MIILSPELLECVVSYLPTKSILNLSFTSKYYHSTIINHDNIWQQVVLNDLSFDKIHQLPNFDVENSKHDETRETSIEIESCEITSYYSMYMKWRTYFFDFPACDIKLGIVWWRRMKQFLSTNAPFILPTLNPPASRDELQKFEKLVSKLMLEDKNRVVLPHYLKLLYLFHNGQSVLTDKCAPNMSMDSFLARNNITENALNQSLFSGLFGGYTYYDQCCSVRFLSLDRMYSQCVKVGSLSLVDRPCGISDDQASENDTIREISISHPNLFPFASSTFYGVDKRKSIYCVDLSNNRIAHTRDVTEDRFDDEVVVNFGSKEAIPAIKHDVGVNATYQNLECKYLTHSSLITDHTAYLT